MGRNPTRLNHLASWRRRNTGRTVPSNKCTSNDAPLLTLRHVGLPRGLLGRPRVTTGYRLIQSRPTRGALDESLHSNVHGGCGSRASQPWPQHFGVENLRKSLRIELAQMDSTTELLKHEARVVDVVAVDDASARRRGSARSALLYRSGLSWHQSCL